MAYAAPSEENFNYVYGDVNDDLELQVIENPYYGDELETEQPRTRTPISNMNNIELITSRQNDYYEM